MDKKIFIATIITIILLILSFWIWISNPKNRINIFFSLTLAFTGLWGLQESFMLIGRSVEWVTFWGMTSYAFGLTIPFFFLFFAIYFPYQNKILDKNTNSLIIIVYLVGAVIAVYPGGVVKEGIIRNGHGDIILNTPVYIIWLIIFIFFFTNDNYFDIFCILL